MRGDMDDAEIVAEQYPALGKIEAGATVSAVDVAPHTLAMVQRVAEANGVGDRVLGESRTEAVRSPAVVLTGNAPQMGGDGGSRTLTVELTAEAMSGRTSSCARLSRASRQRPSSGSTLGRARDRLPAGRRRFRRFQRPWVWPRFIARPP